MSEVVSYAVTDGVGVVTIERPEVRNAMDLGVFDGLRAAAERAGDDPDVGAVLVRGADGVFSSGIDISIFGGQVDGGVDRAFIDRLQRSFSAFEDLDKPTIAAIEGYCFGGGLQLAAACHLRAVAPSAEVSVMEVRWALIPDLGGSYRLPRLVGLGRATEWVLTGRRIPAADALSSGFAQIALGAEDPQADALAFAAALARGPGAVRRAPRLLRENLLRDRDAALDAEAETQMACLEGPDFAEVVSARFEGRDPVFRGV